VNRAEGPIISRPPQLATGVVVMGRKGMPRIAPVEAPDTNDPLAGPLAVSVVGLKTECRRPYGTVNQTFCGTPTAFVVLEPTTGR